MGVRVFNSKTGVSVTCDAKYWAECSDHNPKAGFALWTPDMTRANDIPVYNDSFPEDGSVSAESYAKSAGVEIYDMGKADLEKEVLGHSILSIEDNKITLSNGKVLEIEDTGECCAWFEGEIKAFDFADNVVTGVEEIKHEGNNIAPESWTLRVLSKHKTLAEINIEGDSTSGYYCHSVNLNVKG